MKIDLGGGVYLEPDDGPRNTPFHKRILETRPIADTKTGRVAILECGHQVMTFGIMEHADGVALCTRCRDGAQCK